MSDWEDDDFVEVTPYPQPSGCNSFSKENQTRGRGFKPFDGEDGRKSFKSSFGSSANTFNSSDGDIGRSLNSDGYKGRSFKSFNDDDSGGNRSGGFKSFQRGGSLGGTRSGGPKENNKTKGCFKCGEEGHLSRDCSQGSDGDRKGRKEGPIGEDGKPKSVYIPTDIDDSQLFDQGVNAGINFNKYGNIPVQVTGDDPVLPPFMDFNETGLRKILLDNVAKADYKIPTPIQKHAIPNIMIGRDIMACAQTGSGKTAAFLLPILHHSLENECPSSDGDMAEPTAIIVAPTRELAIQIHCEARKFSIGSYLRCVVVYGGTSVGHQLRNIESGCQVLVATPGRLLDFITRGKVGLGKLKFLVLDEADRMLDLGFMPDVKKLVHNKAMPEKGMRQTLMFSATFPVEVQNLAAEFLKDHIYIVVGVVGAANIDVKQKIILTPQGEKRETLVEQLKNILKNDYEKTLVFVETKRNADFIASYLCLQDLSATSIHGDRMQKQREEALAQFKTGIRNILVATAVAARGLDIRGVGYVINYDLPKSVDEYVHRIGRTGRVGNLGVSISFYDEGADAPLAKDLVKILSEASQEVPDWLMSAAKTSGHVQTYHGQGQFLNRDIRRDKASFGIPKKSAESDQAVWHSEDSSSSNRGAIGYTEPVSFGLGDEDESWD
ncbi:putative ATP-dependent RNA helicase vasa-like isoform X2 [Oratosquilla oratoria]|uniref:putative ATP-dependent RNA helicase vasa-like isoform X2 n=1 Tax=Oratosquilla oratoria TaxID=337810 RepID=UPI003F76AF61